MSDPNVPPRPPAPPTGGFQAAAGNGNGYGNGNGGRPAGPPMAPAPPPPTPPAAPAPPAPPVPPSGGNGGYPPPPPPYDPGGHVPSPGLPEPGTHGSGSAGPSETRKKLSLWDRTKFLVLIVLLFWFFVWSAASDPNPFNTFGDAVDETVRDKWWLFVAVRRRAAAPDSTTWSPSGRPATTASGPTACSAGSRSAPAA